MQLLILPMHEMAERRLSSLTSRHPNIGLAPRTIHNVSYYKPRLGSLETLLP